MTNMLLNTVLIFCLSFAVESTVLEEKYVTFTEVFYFRLSPALFNITRSSGMSFDEDNYSYHASLVGHPDLPSWCQLDASRKGNHAFLYGIVPDPAPELEIVAVNSRSFEASSMVLRFHLLAKPAAARYQVRMKINNFDVGEFLERDSISKLMNIFRIELWPEAAKDLQVTYLASALQHGARKPLRPSDGDGVYITIGSQTPLSVVLLELQREVGPLWASRPCPRDFKKTSLEKNFRNRGFIMDWCSFRLVDLESEASTPTKSESSDDSNEVLEINTETTVGEKEGIWTAPAKHELPVRSYSVDGVVAIFVPIVIGICFICIISFVLGVYPVGQDICEGELYESFFDEFNYESDSMVNIEKQNFSQSDSDEEESFQRQDSESGFLPPSFHHLTPPLAAENGSYSRDSTPYRTSATGTSVEGGRHDSSPYSTLSRSGVRTSSVTPYGSLSRSMARHVEARASTLNRPQPPPYGSARGSTIQQ